MEVQYAPETRQGAVGLPLLEQASTHLEDILGPKRSQVYKAEWNRVYDRKGQTLFRLTLRNSAAEASTDFTTDELKNRLHMQVRLAQLWGDVVEILSEEAHSQVEILSSQITTDSEVMPFGEVLEAADHLSEDEQQELIAILNRRLAQAARQRMVAEIEEARQEFANGRCVPATPEELMREIMK